MKTKGAKLELSAALLIAGSSILLASLPARADEPLKDAISLMKPILDMRLRYETVDQAPLARNANALTLRTRAGFETGKAWGTSILGEVEWVLPIVADYNNSFNGKTLYPTVADPTAMEVNRLQITNISVPGTAITFGRQRINLDDQRFVGAVAWRQNEQTFDAVRVVNKSIDNLTIDAIYLDRVNRVFGPDSRQGRYNGDTFLFNGAYMTSIGKLTGFAYLLQFDRIAGFTAERDSSQTYGARFAGTRDLAGIKWSYAGSYASQTDHKNNPLNFSDDYYLVDLSGVYRQFTGGAGYEVLGGNGVKGFTTPLATLHKFQGWADKFLTTPPNGIRDLYFSAGYNERDVGPFATVSASAIYHRYNAEHISQRYGDEINFQLQAKYDRLMFTLKFADYNARRFATDTQKIWLQVEFIL